MSTLVAQTISNGTVSTSSANVIQGSAKAWVQFTGSGTINNSFNVGSITKNSTGNFTVNFTTAMPNINYVVAGSTVGEPVFWSNYITGTGAANTTSNFRILTQQIGTAYDSIAGIVVFSS